MSRLIDANANREKFKEVVYRTLNDCNITTKKKFNLIMTAFDNMPTAYDISKVVKESNNTWANRIRSMNDEELAEFFEKLETVCDMCACNIGCCNIASKNCKDGFLKWLQSKAEGATENE